MESLVGVMLRMFLFSDNKCYVVQGVIQMFKLGEQFSHYLLITIIMVLCFYSRLASFLRLPQNMEIAGHIHPDLPLFLARGLA